MKKVKVLCFVAVLVVFMLTACSQSQPASTASQASPTTAQSASESSAATSASTDKTEKTLKIGFSHINLNMAWMAEAKVLVEKKAKELGVELIITNANNDKQQQITDVENLISQNVDGLLIAPVDGNAAVPAVEKAIAAGIPVVATIRACPSEGIISFVTGDDLEAGREAGKYIADFIKNKGNVVELIGPLGASPFILRSQGFNEVISGIPGIKLVAQQNAEALRAKAISIMENILTVNPKIDAVFGANDEMAIGAFNAMKSAGRENEAMIITVGGMSETFESIKKGEVDDCIYYPSSMSARGLELLVDHLNGKEVPEKEVVPCALITKDNVEEYITMVK